MENWIDTLQTRTVDKLIIFVMKQERKDLQTESEEILNLYYDKIQKSYR